LNPDAARLVFMLRRGEGEVQVEVEWGRMRLQMLPLLERNLLAPGH
jgi:hypothetical protein